MMTGQWSRCILPLFLFHLSSLSLSFSDSLSLLHALTRSPHTSAHTNTQLVCLLFEVVFSSNPPPDTSGKSPTRHKFSIRKKWHCRGPFYKINCSMFERPKITNCYRSLLLTIHFTRRNGNRAAATNNSKNCMNYKIMSSNSFP